MFLEQRENELNWMDAEHTTGTTIMAIEIKDGVIIGADSRSTTGIYVANRAADKLTKVTDNIYCCRSGSAADTQAIADIVSYNLEFHKMELNEMPCVETAGSLFQEMCYNYRNSLTAGIIVAGWDKQKGGQVYSIPLGGMCVRQPMTLGGSGSSYIYGYCDENFKHNMTKEEGMEFVKKAVSLAILRDAASGGCVRIAILSKNPIERYLYLGDEIFRVNNF